MKVSSSELKTEIVKVIPKSLLNDDVIFVCIGTDRSTGDSLAPMIGTLLVEKGYKNVYGTLEQPIHAMNLKQIIETLPKNKTIIAIDACLGALSSVGLFEVNVGSIKPGAGVGKELPAVGDYSITGIVNVGGFMEYFVLQNTRLSLVSTKARTITDGLVSRFPLYNKESHLSISRSKISNYIKKDIKY